MHRAMQRPLRTQHVIQRLDVDHDLGQCKRDKREATRERGLDEYADAEMKRSEGRNEPPTQ